jgi:hypothetical protein
VVFDVFFIALVLPVLAEARADDDHAIAQIRVVVLSGKPNTS